jgi:hypothetical protein
LAVLRKPAAIVTPGTIEAASAHIRTLSESGHPQLKDAHRQLDGLCGLQADPTERQPEQANEQRAAAILRLCQETVRSSSPRRSQRVGSVRGRDYQAPGGPFVALHHSPSALASAAS